MKLLSSAQTDRGKIRANNEDSYCAEQISGLFAVADGIGGQSAGEIASKMAVDVIRDHIGKAGSEQNAFPGEYRKDLSQETNRLADGIRLANQVIYEASLSNPEWRNMGTTVASVLLTGDRLSIGHVGDSRVYLIRAHSIIRLTEDHSLIAEQVRLGLMTSEEAAKSKMKNIITRALGKGRSVDVETAEVSVIPGDKLILCSDGLSSMISDETILTIVSSSANPDLACKALVDAANKNGGRDNITAIVVYIFENSWNYYLSRIF